jgi:hypothetical protein
LQASVVLKGMEGEEDFCHVVLILKYENIENKLKRKIIK